MLETVDVVPRPLEAYRGVAADDLLDTLERAAGPLEGRRVVHINATSFGGGVSELMRSMVPLMNHMGIVTDWKIITGDEAFFNATKKLHNALQGAPETLTKEDWEAYEATAEKNARRFEEKYDAVVIHDPQPAAMLEHVDKGDTKWIWRCHIDTSDPNPEAWSTFRKHLSMYDAAVFTMREFIPKDLPVKKVGVIPPAIDPLSPKNFALRRDMARNILGWIGVDPARPLITQVSRFDPWKDPMGVVDAYRIAKKEIPGLQLALVGSMALDDPEGWEIYDDIMEEAKYDPLVHVFSNITGVGNIEVNAFQTLSDVVIQKSIKEGFGLVVSEAMWKGTPVVAGRTGGIPLQMADGVGGRLVESVEECAQGIIEFIKDPPRAREIGAKGRARVRELFLVPRLVLDELEFITSLLDEETATAAILEADHDPVCGMAVTQPTITTRIEGQRYSFCSGECQHHFLERPEKYLHGLHSTR